MPEPDSTHCGPRPGCSSHPLSISLADWPATAQQLLQLAAPLSSNSFPRSCTTSAFGQFRSLPAQYTLP
jgi:hypothetical protein